MSAIMGSAINKHESSEADSRENNDLNFSAALDLQLPIRFPVLDLQLPPIRIRRGDTRLRYTYGIWCSRRIPGGRTNLQNIQLLGRFASIQQFWRYYDRLTQPDNLRSHSSLHIFKDGIKPVLQDPSNIDGGQWVVCIDKRFLPLCWEPLLLAMLGEQFMVGDDICGVEVSTTTKSDKIFISLWNRSSADTMVTTKIRDTLKKVLNLPLSTVFEYKKNIDLISDLENSLGPFFILYDTKE